MRLQFKLGLPLIIGQFIVVALVMGWLFYSVSNQFSNFAHINNEQLKTFQIQAAEKLFGATNAVLHKRIKMGNKSGLRVVLHKQHVEGVEEVSVFSQAGKVVFSSKDQYLGRKIDEKASQLIENNKQKISLWTERGVEIYDPQIITKKCTMCHIHAAWRGKEDAIGGITYFRASTDAFTKLSDLNQTAMLNMKQSISTIVIISLLIMLAVSAILIVMLVKKLVRTPLNNTLEMLKDIAEGEGDLTSRLKVKSKDEIGLVSKWFNVFVEKIQSMIIALAGDAKSLSRSSSCLTDLSGQMKTSTDLMNTKSNDVANAAEKMNRQMAEMSASMQDATANVNQISVAIGKITDAIQSVSKNTENASQVADQAVQKNHHAAVRINALGEAAQKISKITETITEISEQTNLLALNATIEAARAGDAGKGFAVVASEIKELARQTANATENIKQMIDSIQGTTIQTIDEMEQVSKIFASVDDIVSNIASSVREQTIGMTDISNNINQTTQGIQDLNENLMLSTSFASEIAENMADVKKSANEILTSSSSLDASAKDMSESATHLHKMVNAFKV